MQLHADMIGQKSDQTGYIEKPANQRDAAHRHGQECTNLGHPVKTLSQRV
jgi:hypothetical protein